MSETVTPELPCPMTSAWTEEKKTVYLHWRESIKKLVFAAPSQTL
jgi:hypothetical protein